MGRNTGGVVVQDNVGQFNKLLAAQLAELTLCLRESDIIARERQQSC